MSGGTHEDAGKRGGTRAGGDSGAAAGSVEIRVDGRPLRVDARCTVAAALINAGVWALRTSVTQTARGPVCGMGICYECRVTIDGVAQRRSCLHPVAAGMEIDTRA